MNQEDQIIYLNSHVKVRIAPSKIHGVGIHALRQLYQGDKLYSDLFPRAFNLPYASFGKLFPEVRQILLERWPNIVNGSKFMYPDVRLQAYVNHSNDPNYDAEGDVMLKDIKEGQEITEDYRRIEGWEKVFPWIKNEA